MRLWPGALLLIGLITEVCGLPRHIRMCLVMFSVYFVLKCESLRAHCAAGNTVSVRDAILWFLTWPGLNPARFFRHAKSIARASEWAWAVSKTTIGLVLWLVLAPAVVGTRVMVGGWTAMIGMVLTVHFGFLHLVAIFWRTCGRDVRPIMNAPLASESLSEFWGRRWNLAFRDFAHGAVFKPAARRWSAGAATWISFVFSGLVHELAISVPAGGGYGLPTLYFFLQALGVHLERVFRFRGGLRGWAFAALFLMPGAVFLFHPPFVRNVVLPLIPGGAY